MLHLIAWKSLAGPQHVVLALHYTSQTLQILGMSVQQLEVFPTALHLKRIDLRRNTRRYHRMVVQPDLFGGASLVQEWGCIGVPGRLCRELHRDEGQAITQLMKLADLKCQRGYQIAPCA